LQRDWAAHPNAAYAYMMRIILLYYVSFLRRRMSTSFLFMWVWWTEKNPDLLVRQRTRNDEQGPRTTHHALVQL
jgi:hypothetical protein